MVDVLFMSTTSHTWLFTRQASKNTDIRITPNTQVDTRLCSQQPHVFYCYSLFCVTFFPFLSKFSIYLSWFACCQILSNIIIFVCTMQPYKILVRGPREYHTHCIQINCTHACLSCKLCRETALHTSHIWWRSSHSTTTLREQLKTINS